MSLFSLKTHTQTNRFEGWYVRFQDVTNDVNQAFILAFTNYVDDRHAFTQRFDGQKQKATYDRYERDAFAFVSDTVHIGPQKLSLNQFFYQDAALTIDIQLTQSSRPRKSAMSFLRFLPLECFQEVIVLDGQARGTLTAGGETREVEGKIYIEKTYGRRFPKQWFWLQAQQFDDPSVRLSFAGGSIPTFKFRPFGFFCLVEVNGAMYRFATYNRAKFHQVDLGDKVVFTLRKRSLQMRIEVSEHNPTALVGPNDYGQMNLEVFESLTAYVTVTLTRGDQTLIHSSSPWAGFEWMGQQL